MKFDKGNGMSNFQQIIMRLQRIDRIEPDCRAIVARLTPKRLNTSTEHINARSTPARDCVQHEDTNNRSNHGFASQINYWYTAMQFNALLHQCGN